MPSSLANLTGAEDEWWWRNVSSKDLFSTVWRESSTKPIQHYTGPASDQWPASQALYEPLRIKRPKEAASRWNSIVTQYSERQLTKRRDKLVAIGAVAQIYGRLNGLPVDREQEFLAGCWRSHMPYGLVWFAGLDGERHVATTPEDELEDSKYPVPTWSWASMDGSVRFSPYDGPSMKEFPNGKIKSLAKLIEGAVTTEGGAFGPVTGGHIILKGPLYRIRVNKKAEDSQKWGWAREFTVLKQSGASAGKKEWPFSEMNFCLDSWKKKLDEWPIDREMHLAVLHKDFALLLEKVDNKGKGWYKRIGATPLPSYKEIKSLAEGLWDEGQMLADDDYIDVDVEKRCYTYGIV